MLRWTLPVLILLAACSKGPEADLPSIQQARSLGAEWALVNEQAATGRLTSTYVATMHRQLRQNLRTTEQSLSDPHASYAAEIRALLGEDDDASPDRLRAHVAALKQIEDHLESA